MSKFAEAYQDCATEEAGRVAAKSGTGELHPSAIVTAKWMELLPLTSSEDEEGNIYPRPTIQFEIVTDSLDEKWIGAYLFKSFNFKPFMDKRTGKPVVYDTREFCKVWRAVTSEDPPYLDASGEEPVLDISGMCDRLAEEAVGTMWSLKLDVKSDFQDIRIQSLCQ